MNDDSTLADVEALLVRLRRGDSDARHKLLMRTYERLRKLAGALLTRNFPRLRDRHQLDSVVHEAWIRLDQALAGTHPATPLDFFHFATHKVRQVLLDMVSRADRRREQPLEEEDRDDPSADPAQLACWTEFHERIEHLPAAQREVFELRFYHGLTNRQIAELLGLAEKPVSRLWLAASEQVAEALSPDLDPC